MVELTGFGPAGVRFASPCDFDLRELLGCGQAKRPAPVCDDSGRAVTALVGRWRIVEMDLWDEEDVDLVAPGFIEFGPNHRGSLGFVAVQGGVDWRETSRDGRSGLEFSWEGFDDSDPASGRGWAVLEDDGSLRGHIYFHVGDDSGFRGKRDR
jgi:hypothetical protein